MARKGEKSGPPRNGYVEINVGGEIIPTLRSTLRFAKGSMFASLFTGKWKADRDDQGRVFLDYDPELVKLIIQHLQFKRIEKPFNPFPPPTAPAGKEMKLEELMDFFGLKEFFNPIVPFLEDHSIAKVSYYGRRSIVSVANVEETNFIHSGPLATMGDTCSLLQSGLNQNSTGTFWKVTIDRLRPNKRVCLGVSEINGLSVKTIGWGNVAEIDEEYDPPSFFSFSSCSFEMGECLYFRLCDTKLSMFSVDKNRVWTKNHLSLRKHLILFFFGHEDAKVTVSCLHAKERFHFLSKLVES